MKTWTPLLRASPGLPVERWPVEKILEGTPEGIESNQQFLPIHPVILT
jgi:hypothetical protein